MTVVAEQVVAVEGFSVRLPSTRPAEPANLTSFTEDMPRCVPIGRWDCERDSFTPATRMSTRFASFMTGTPRLNLHSATFGVCFPLADGGEGLCCIRATP